MIGYYPLGQILSIHNNTQREKKHGTNPFQVCVSANRLGDFGGEVRKLTKLGSYAQPQGHYQRKGPAIQGSKDLLFEFHRAYTVQSKPSDDSVYIYQPPFNQNSVTTIHPPKQTWNLITSWKTGKIYTQPILGFHVNFWGCANKKTQQRLPADLYLCGKRLRDLDGVCFR